MCWGFQSWDSSPSRPHLPCEHGWVPSTLGAAHHVEGKKVPVLSPFKLGHLCDFEFMTLGIPHLEGAFNRSGAPCPGRCPRTVVFPSSVQRRHAGYVCVCSAPSGGCSGTLLVQALASHSAGRGLAGPGGTRKSSFLPFRRQGEK